MADWMHYPVKTPLLDVKVTQLTQNGQIKSNQGSTNTVGSNSTIEITSNTINTTAIPNGQVADATDIIVIPPVLADGTTPDAEFYFEVDGQTMDKYQIYDGSADGNMFPVPQLNLGRRISLGYSLRDALSKIARGENFANVMLRCTGLKITQGLRVTVKSTAGWGPGGNNTSTVVTPMRIIVLGDALDRQTIDPLTQYLVNASSIFVKSPYFSDVTLPMPTTAGTLSSIWNTLPGGVKQGAIKVNRRINYATNALATSTSKIYAFTQSQKMLGGEDNVSSNEYDLGDDFSDPTNNSIFIYDGLGLRLPTNVDAYVGFNVDGSNIPNNAVQAGLPVSASLNPLHFGSVQPVRSESNLYYGIPAVQNLTNMIVQNNAVVPFINTSGTTAIAAGNVKMAKTGILIERQ